MLTLAAGRLDSIRIGDKFVRADGRNETQSIKVRDLKFNNGMLPSGPMSLSPVSNQDPRVGHLLSQPRSRQDSRNPQPWTISNRSIAPGVEMERSLSRASSSHFSQVTSSELCWDGRSVASSNTSWATTWHSPEVTQIYNSRPPLILDGSGNWIVRPDTMTDQASDDSKEPHDAISGRRWKPPTIVNGSNDWRPSNNDRICLPTGDGVVNRNLKE